MRWLAWYIPSLVWWNNETHTKIQISFWGPFQAPLIMVIREYLDPDTGLHEYAEVIWDSTPKWLINWRAKRAEAKRARDYFTSRLAFYESVRDEHEPS